MPSQIKVCEKTKTQFNEEDKSQKKSNTQAKLWKKRQVPEKIKHPGKTLEKNTSPRKKSNTQAELWKKIQVPEQFKHPGEIYEKKTSPRKNQLPLKGFTLPKLKTLL